MTQITSDAGLDAEQLDMLRGSLRHVLGEASPRPLGERLSELGWDELVADDAPAAWGALFDVKGELAASVDALGPALAAYLADRTGDPSLAGAMVALPSPYGDSTESDGSLAVEATTTVAPGAAPLAVPVGDRLAIVDASGLACSPIAGFDDLQGLQRVTGLVASTDARWADGVTWPDVVARGRWLLACELVGIGRHVVAAAVDYTKQRVQYGQPIGVFQALQHRLASAHALVVGAGHLADEAGRSGDSWTALVAKCMAGRAAEEACTQAQQCYGAIGFTWEHEFHRYLRRTYALDRLFGDWRTLEHEIGDHLQATNAVPRIGTL